MKRRLEDTYAYVKDLVFDPRICDDPSLESRARKLIKELKRKGFRGEDVQRLEMVLDRKTGPRSGRSSTNGSIRPRSAQSSGTSPSNSTSRNRTGARDQTDRASRIQVPPHVRRGLQQILHALSDASRKNPLRNRGWGATFYGPPGTGKTETVAAFAEAIGVDLVTLSPADFSEYKGSGAREIRRVAQEAANNSPCIVFVDEAESIMGDRNHIGSGEHHVKETVTQSLSDLPPREPGVVAIASTNNIQDIDPAHVKRSGRFGDVRVYFGLPCRSTRLAILRNEIASIPGFDTNDAHRIAEKLAVSTAGWSPAELVRLVECARSFTLDDAVEDPGSKGTTQVTNISSLVEEFLDGPTEVGLPGWRHFRRALNQIEPALSPGDIRRYRETAREFRFKVPQEVQ